MEQQTRQLERHVQDDLDLLLHCLPPRVVGPLRNMFDLSGLLEVVLDLARPPEARFPDGDAILDTDEVSPSDLDYVISRIGEFGDDNRSGIERTLHRISAIRNRKGRILGITCRVGRAVYGTIKTIEDLVFSGKNILLLGRPGVGKTTMLREVSRVLADTAKKRVIVVDTSNEIAGDGDIPHPAIGHARRMQVAASNLQHAVMIEAVENHMPQVIVIDEMGTELEAAAARTIAERGVQLIATAHGNSLDNLILNPTPLGSRRRHPDRHPGRRRGPLSGHPEERVGAEGPAHFRRCRRDSELGHRRRARRRGQGSGFLAERLPAGP